jgi:hypothetical protein
MTTTTTNSTPGVPLPPGTEAYTDWEPGPDGAHRIIWGDKRTVEATGISLQPHAVQLDDGSIAVTTRALGDRPGIAIDAIWDDGSTQDCFNVTLDGARHLIAALTVLIDEVDGWTR